MHSHDENRNTVWKEFDDNITHSATHYLFAIHELHKESGYARMIDVSKKLKITPGSCSTGVKALMKKGLIEEDQNKFLLLSKKGADIIKQIEKNRDVLIEFFTKNLGINSKKAEIDACKIEHLLSKDTIKSLENYIQKK